MLQTLGKNGVLLFLVGLLQQLSPSFKLFMEGSYYFNMVKTYNFTLSAKYFCYMKTTFRTALLRCAHWPASIQQPMGHRAKDTPWLRYTNVKRTEAKRSFFLCYFFKKKGLREDHLPVRVAPGVRPRDLPPRGHRPQGGGEGGHLWDRERYGWTGRGVSGFIIISPN